MQQAEYRCPAKRGVAIGVCLTAVLSASSAHAAVSISTLPTQNMSCSNGVCTPTAKQAVLNTGNLETLLASGNVTVTTTGSGVEASNIAVKSALSWSATSSLSLSAHRNVAIDAPVSVVGISGLSFQTGSKNATLTFGKKGSVGFSNLSSQLAINGVTYTLVGNIKTLAADIASDPSGAFAFGGTYDASADGTYTASPVGTPFTGTFEGLGNTILNLSVDGLTFVNDQGVFSEGLFAEIGATGTARDIGLVGATFVKPAVHHSYLLGVGGVLAGVNAGTIQNCYATGTIRAGLSPRASSVGGLVGDNSGAIQHSYATVAVTSQSTAGGLVGLGGGVISASHATGAVVGSQAGGLVGGWGGIVVTESYATGSVTGGVIGGLIGDTGGSTTITNSYATGSVTGGTYGAAGGLIGGSSSKISFSYSTGEVTGGTGSYVGGFIGNDGGTNNDNDWDTTTSGITNLSQGAGNIANDPGITGLSTAQFQSGLPPGFDPKIWAEKPNINGGLPYLIANPPQ